MKTFVIKHKLWGKLKKRAHDSYKIVPAENSQLYFIEYEDGYRSSIYTLEEAIDRLEELRIEEFQKLCYQALYERRKKKVKDI